MDGDMSLNGNLSVINQDSQTIINTTVNEYTSIVTEDISLNGKLSVSGDVSFNSTGRVDICGNLHAQYAADSIPLSAISGGGGGGVDLTQDISVNSLTVGKGSGNVATNTAFGIEALYSNTTGNHNTANGYQALQSNTTGNYNVANGSPVLGNR